MNYFRSFSSSILEFKFYIPLIKCIKSSNSSENSIIQCHAHFSNSLVCDLHSVPKSPRNLFDKISPRIPPTQLQPNFRTSSRESISEKTHKLFNDQFNAHAETSIQMFDETTTRNIISWTAKISSIARSKREEEAIGCFKSMLAVGERPNHVTLLSVIHVIGSIGSEDLVRKIHSIVIKMGFESELSVVTALLGVYSLHEMQSVFNLFNETPNKDLILWSAMVAACSKNGQFIAAINVFLEMQRFGIEPNNVCILSVLNACADLGALSAGKQIHGFSIRKELVSDTSIQNSLVDMYAKCGKLDASILIFDRIEKKDLVSWNTMICGCAENGHPRTALALFSTLRSCYIEPDETTTRNLLAACSQMGECMSGLALHSYILKDGLLNFISVGTALLKMYADFGEVAASRALFDSLHRKDFIAWSAMVSVYAQAGHPNHAVEMFKKMQSVNEKPNEITLVSLLQACSSMGGAQEHGKSIHSHVLRNGYFCNMFITSALIDLYCKFGRLRQGKALFDLFPKKDLVCWSSMINGYAMNGCGEEALEAFSRMIESGVQPNDVVFISVLSACSHCGLVDEGWKLFRCMENDFGIRPSLVHYACMVDLLSRCGQVMEAFQFIKGMPMEPDPSIWGALIGGCKVGHGHVEVAEVAVQQLLKLDPDNTSYYVILSNVYAECGRWADVERLRKVVKERRLRKTLGHSMVEAG